MKQANEQTNKQTKNKRNITLLLVVLGVMLLAFLVACGNDQTPPANEGGAGTDEEQTNNEHEGPFVVFGVISDEGYWAEIWRRAEEEFPHLDIEYTNFTSERFAELFTAARHSGEQIDVMILNAQDLRRYATAGDLVPMCDVPFLDRFTEIGIKTFTIQDRLWALPIGSAGGFTIFWNQTVLDSIGESYPETYEDLVRIGQRLGEEGISAFTHAGQNIYLWPVWFFSTYAQTTNNMSLEYTIETLQGYRKFTDPEVVEALDLVFQFARDGLFIEGINSTDGDASLSNMITGRAVFALGLNWRAVLEATDGSIELGVGLLPYLTPGRVQPQYPGGPGLALTIFSGATPERQATALAFLDFFTSDDNVQFLANEANWAAPSNVNVRAEGINPLMEYFSDNVAEHLVTYLDWYWPPEITRAFQEGIQAGVALQRTAEEVAQDIQDEFDRLVAAGYEFVD